jgi:hypothetical protein
MKMVNVNIRSFNLDGSPKREIQLQPRKMKNRFSSPRKFEESFELEESGTANFPLLTSINLGISKYDVKSNGSPVRKNKRQ